MSSSPPTARGPGHRYSARTRARARRLFSQHGWQQARIARHLAVPEDTVRRWLADVNPGTGNARRYDRAKILAEHEAGVTRAELRACHGCSERFLSDLINGKLPP